MSSARVWRRGDDPRIRLSVPPVLWYENAKGERWLPPADYNGSPPPPDGFTYMHSQFPTDLHRSMLRLEGDRSIPIGTAVSGWDQELVLAMATRRPEGGKHSFADLGAIAGLPPHPIPLARAILIVANCCGRCLNALRWAYGIRDSYSPASVTYAEKNTRCEFCATPEELNAIADATGPGERFFEDTPKTRPELFRQDEGLEDAPPAIARSRSPQNEVDYVKLDAPKAADPKVIDFPNAKKGDDRFTI